MKAKSTVHGWGAYTAAGMPKGIFIGQYTREIISNHEGDIHGVIYYVKGVNYLLDPTKTPWVDPTRLGSDLRYVNHSENPIPNCIRKLLRH